VKGRAGTAPALRDPGKGFHCPRMDDGMSASRVRDSARYLADNDWLRITVEAGKTRIGLGSRARKLLEGASANRYACLVRNLRFQQTRKEHRGDR
jgi:hypothetical protein